MLFQKKRILAVALGLCLCTTAAYAIDSNSSFLEILTAIQNSTGQTTGVNTSTIDEIQYPSDYEELLVAIENGEDVFEGETALTTSEDVTDTETQTGDGTTSTETGTSTDTSTSTSTDTSTETTTGTTTETTTGTTTETTTGTTTETTAGTTTETTTGITTESTTVTYTETTATLTQRYNSTFAIYEYSPNNRYYVYSNAENGDIISGSVYVDIPYNVEYIMAKDGITTSYTRNTSITELGSYLFTFTYTDEAALTRYISTFRFRLEAPLAEETTTTTTTAPTTDDLLNEDLTDEEWQAIYDQLYSDTEYSDGDVPALESDLDVDADLDIDAMLDETLTDDDAEVETTVTTPVVTATTDPLITSGYNEEKEYYEMTLRTGSSVYSSVPNGMITNGQVVLYQGEGAVTMEVYLDGELMENFKAGVALKDAGAYTVLMTEESVDYLLAYDSDVQVPAFSFTIASGIADATLGVFNVPQDVTVSQILLGETPLEIKTGESQYYLDEDGTYAITLVSEANEQVVTLVKDTKAPQFTVDTSASNVATVTYYDTDLADVILSSNGEVVSSGQYVNDVSGAGIYTLTVVDNAGNSTSQTFEVVYGLNTAAILAMFVILALCVGGIFTVRRFRSKVAVR